jgi:arylsulfatase A-like enzyme
VSDDTGWCDLGVYGGGEGRGMPTPNLDHMAVEGVTGSLLCPAELHAGPLGDPDRPDSK